MNDRIQIGVMDVVLSGAMAVGDEADAEAQMRARFDAAASLGFAGIELNLDLGPLKAGRFDGRALREQAAAAGLTIPSLVLGEHNGGGLATWFRGPGAEEEVRLAVKACVATGAATLLVPFFFFNEPKGRAHQRMVAEKLKPLCAEAAAEGVVIAYEGVLPAERLLAMADHVGRDGFGVYFDPANVRWCDSDPAAEIRQLGPLLRQCHAKDADVCTGDARLGEGRIDHDVVAAALREIGYTGWVVLETMGGPADATAAELDFVRQTYTNGAAA